MNLKETYNKIAKDWVQDHNRDDWWQEGADVFFDMLPTEAHVLDIGCGGGIKTKYIHDKGYLVSGIDFSENMIAIAQKNLPWLDFEVVDIYEIDKYNKTFDGIFAQAVLLHIEKKRILEVLEKLKLKLNPGGLLYVAVKGMKDSGVEEHVVEENDYGYPYQRFFSYYNLQELEEYFQKLDMKIVWKDIKRSGKTDWVQIVAKKV